MFYASTHSVPSLLSEQFLFLTFSEHFIERSCFLMRANFLELTTNIVLAMADSRAAAGKFGGAVVHSEIIHSLEE